MKLTPQLSGAYFGNLAKYRNIVTVRLSPYELKPFAGIISNGIPNTIRRIRSQFFRVAPPMILGYLVYDWGNAENERLSRKNPKDFENDV